MNVYFVYLVILLLVPALLVGLDGWLEARRKARYEAILELHRERKRIVDWASLPSEFRR